MYTPWPSAGSPAFKGLESLVLRCGIFLTLITLFVTPHYYQIRQLQSEGYGFSCQKEISTNSEDTRGFGEGWMLLPPKPRYVKR